MEASVFSHYICLFKIFQAKRNIKRSLTDDLKAMHRGLGAYLSIRDQGQLFVKSIETENIENENGIPFQIFYGISDNSHKFWSITNAREVIDYAPEDNSAFRFAERLAELFKEAKGT